MMRKLLAVVVATLVLAGTALAQVRVTGAGAGLGDLIGSPTLVTVVLKGGAKDANLRVIATKGSTLEFMSEKGEQVLYTISGIEEIQVQGSKVEKAEPTLLPDVLAPGDKQVVERAYGRAKEIFDAAAKEQGVKIQMAAVLTAKGDEDAKKYLEQLAASGELQTELEASKALYLAGQPVPESVLRRGLDSGNRVIKGAAAELSGLAKFEDSGALLVRLAQDRAWEISGPASRAVARLGNREIVPLLLNGLNERNEEKAAAVIWSLLRLGGKDIAEQLKLKLPQTAGLEKYRIVYLLYRLQDPEGKRLLIDAMRDMPTLELEAALALGRDRDVSAMDILRQRLKRREDETEVNLINRARTAEALIKGGDPAPKGVLQELMRSPKKKVRASTLALIARLNNRSMLSLMQSSIENVDNATAAEAVTTAIALGSSDFRTRLMDLRSEEEAVLSAKK